jgi:hypothetical protein
MLLFAGVQSIWSQMPLIDDWTGTDIPERVKAVLHRMGNKDF